MDEQGRFFAFARKYCLTAYDRVLWMALWEARRMAGEPEGFFRVANAEMSALSGLEERKIRTVRERLERMGLIQFRKGEGRGSDPEYWILPVPEEQTGGKNAPDGDAIGCKNVPDTGRPGANLYPMDGGFVAFGCKNVADQGTTGCKNVADPDGPGANLYPIEEDRVQNCTRSEETGCKNVADQNGPGAKMYPIEEDRVQKCTRNGPTGCKNAPETADRVQNCTRNGHSDQDDDLIDDDYIYQSSSNQSSSFQEGVRGSPEEETDVGLFLSETVREQLRQEGYADWEMEEVARRAPTGKKIRSPAAYLRKAMEYNRKSRAGTPGRDYSMRPESEYEWTERPEDMIRRLQDEMGG